MFISPCSSFTGSDQRISLFKKPKKSFLRNFFKSIYFIQIRQFLKFRRYPPMQRKKLPINNRPKRKTIKQLHKHIINLPIKLHQNLLPKIKITSQLPTLMIPPQNMNMIPIPNLQTQKQNKYLNRITPPINKIAQKQIIRFTRISSNFQNFTKIIILTVNISYYCYRIFYM